MAANESNGNGNGNGKRKRWLLGLMLLFLLAGAGYGAYWWFIGQFEESTDDAYVGGNLVQLTSRVAGTVVAINGDNTDLVRQGQPVVLLDKTDATVALEQVEAQLGETVRQVRQLFESTAELKANVALRQAELAKAQEDFDRRQALIRKNLISTEDFQHARVALETAQAALTLAQRQLASANAMVDNTTLEQHPRVRQAAAKLRDVYLNLQRTTLPAPVTGYIAKRSVQLGQRINPGEALLAIVPLEQVWVDANFKEGQLRHVRIGQPVTLTADLYGSAVDYRGTVVGLGAGTGSVFSLLPPQNATGNWIKVVQRVPVRIALDPAPLEKYPLRIGLSMQVSVDTHDRGGVVLPPQPRSRPAYTTPVFADDAAPAKGLIDKIVCSNTGRSATESSGLKPAEVLVASRLDLGCH